MLQATNNSLGEDAGTGVLNHCAALQEIVSESKQEGGALQDAGRVHPTISRGGHGGRNVAVHRPSDIWGVCGMTACGERRHEDTRLRARADCEGERLL